MKTIVLTNYGSAKSTCGISRRVRFPSSPSSVSSLTIASGLMLSRIGGASSSRYLVTQKLA